MSKHANIVFKKGDTVVCLVPGHIDENHQEIVQDALRLWQSSVYTFPEKLVEMGYGLNPTDWDTAHIVPHADPIIIIKKDALS